MTRELMTLVEAIRAVAVLPENSTRTALLMELTKSLAMWNGAQLPQRTVSHSALEAVEVAITSRPTETIARVGNGNRT